MAIPAMSGVQSTRYHFPQLGEDGTCGKSIKPASSRSNERCGQRKEGSRHLYYRCRVRRDCTQKSWSIEQRIDHEKGCKP